MSILLFLHRYGLSYLGDCEKADPGHEDQSHGVKPTSDVRQNPQRKAEFDGIQHIFHQEQTSELNEGGIEFIGGVVGNLVNFVLWDCQVDVCKREYIN